MDYRQFQQLLSARGSEEKSALVLLQDFVQEYPYCQTGQLLLTRSMYLQDHVRYEQQLKRTAIATPDRAALFNLIHREPASAASSSPLLVSDENSSPFRTATSDFPLTVNPSISETEHPLFGGDITTGEKEKTADVSLLKNFSATEESHDTVSSSEGHDPHDLVRERLEALLAKKEVPSADKVDIPVPAAPEPTPEPISEIPVSGREETAIEAIPGATEAPVFDIAERELALEASLLQELEQLPVIEPAIIEAVEKLDIAPTSTNISVKDFTYWLSQPSTGDFGRFDEIHATSVVEEISGGLLFDSTVNHTAIEPATTSETTTSSHLIERFIATEPRIVPQPKAEFFNPALQAKRSVEEHDDLVSETLARIYADQGNLTKARTAYEKLGLLHPEKSAYFAALIQKIDNQLNSEEI